MTELAFGLKKKGYDVEVYTSQPISDVKVETKKREILNGVEVVRMVSLRMSKNTKFGKAFNYLTFFISVCIKTLFSKKINNIVYLIVSNPPFLPFIGVILSIFRKSKFIHLIHDIQPDEAVSFGYISKNNIIVKIWGKINKLIYKKSISTIVLSEQMKKYLTDKYTKLKINNGSGDSITVIHNWADHNFIKPIDNEENPYYRKSDFKGKFIINYSGNLGVVQKFDALFQVAEKLKKENVVFLIRGDGVKKKQFIKYAQDNELVNIIFFDYVKKEELPYVLNLSDLSVVMLEKELEGLAMPSKLYTNLACGKPILAFCDEKSDLGIIIKKANCGFIVNQTEAERITNIIRKLREDRKLYSELSYNARNYFINNFRFDLALREYCKVIDNVSKLK